MKPVCIAPLILLAAFCVHVADVSLAWNPSVSESAVGYRVYVGTASGAYTVKISVGRQTTYIVTALGPATWYFAVTAVDAYGNESGFSNEVSKIITSPIAFQITSMSASLRWFGVVIQCTTSQKASAILRYSKIEAGAGTTAVIATVGASKTTHRAVLYLPAEAAYYRYEWEVTDAAGNIIKQNATFQTR
jgi:hypothetical protein